MASNHEIDKRVIPEGRIAPHTSGFPMLAAEIISLLASIACILLGIRALCFPSYVLGTFLLIFGTLISIWFIICLFGFKVIGPNQAYVFTLFGKYYGTLKTAGFYYVNPFVTANAPARTVALPESSSGIAVNKTLPAVSKKISLKTRTLDNRKQKVNDALGNPIIIGSVVIWHVEDPTVAVFAVDNYEEYLSIQCDSTIRNIARLYPFDTMEDDIAEKTLRGSSNEISENMERELSERVRDAGIVIEDVRITTLAYAEEIAAAMLQRQQAVAIIAARQKIVEGAVSMVKMAIDQLSEDHVVTLDEERKAAMVSNLLVVLCGSKDAQPVVNSGSLY